MGARHSHQCRHAHGGAAGSQHRKRLAIVLVLVTTYTIAEAIGWLLTDSLTLLADAGHMLSSAGAIALSLFAIKVAQKPVTSQRTNGYYRTEMLAALISGGTLVATSAYIFYQAYQRIVEPPEVPAALMLGIATGGLLIKLIALWILHAGKSESLNVRGAWLHVLVGVLGSAGAITAGMLVWSFGWDWADPVACVMVGVLVFYSSWHVLKKAVAVLVEGASGYINVEDVREAMQHAADLSFSRDMYVRTITSGTVSLSAHVVVGGNRPSQEVLAEIRKVLLERFGIDHATIQLERAGFEESKTLL